MKRILFLLILPLTLFGFEEPYHVTAFIAPKGTLDILPSYTYYSTHQFWNKNGKRLPAFNHFRRHSIQLYGEYALNTCNSLTINGGGSCISETLHKNSSGIHDLELGWKHIFYNTTCSALTSQLIAIIPTGRFKSTIRYGRCGLQAGLLYSHTWSKAWIDTGLAYRYYQGFPSDQALGYFAIGYHLFDRVTLINTWNLEYGFFNGKEHFNQNHIVLNPNYRLLTTQLECIITLCRHISITLGGFQHLWGQNVGTNGGVYGGAWFTF